MCVFMIDQNWPCLICMPFRIWFPVFICIFMYLHFYFCRHYTYRTRFPLICFAEITNVDYPSFDLQILQRKVLLQLLCMHCRARLPVVHFANITVEDCLLFDSLCLTDCTCCCFLSLSLSLSLSLCVCRH